MLIAAKLVIAQNWKAETVPSIGGWHMKCQYLLLMNKLTVVKKEKGQVLAMQLFMKKRTIFMDDWIKATPQDSMTKAAAFAAFFSSCSLGCSLGLWLEVIMEAAMLCTMRRKWWRWQPGRNGGVGGERKKSGNQEE